MAYNDYETQRRAAISPLYGSFASMIYKLERALSAPHFCNPPAGHAPVAHALKLIAGPKTGEPAQPTYTCPECGLSWHQTGNDHSPENLHIFTPAASNAA